MPLLEASPEVILLRAAVDQIKTVDWPGLTGLAAVTVRHGRFRGFNGGERPGIALRYIGSGPLDPEQQVLSAYETLCQMEISMDVEATLDSEESGDDETGLLRLSRMATAAVNSLRDPAGLFYPRIHEIFVTEKEADEDSTPDKARLSWKISVLYRVRTDEENVLLGIGSTGL